VSPPGWCKQDQRRLSAVHAHHHGPASATSDDHVRMKLDVRFLGLCDGSGEEPGAQAGRHHVGAEGPYKRRFRATVRRPAVQEQDFFHDLLLDYLSNWSPPNLIKNLFLLPFNLMNGTFASSGVVSVLA
jgi:hypothetical protein